MAETTENKRRFTRVIHDSRVIINSPSKTWQTQLIDVSLKGALVTRPDGWEISPGDKFSINIELGENADIVICMEVVAIAHTEENNIGFECLDIDVESISHLKRLMELNLGDSDLIHRELSALGQSS